MNMYDLKAPENKEFAQELATKYYAANYDSGLAEVTFSLAWNAGRREGANAVEDFYASVVDTVFIGIGVFLKNKETD